MRLLVTVLLLGCSLAAQEISPETSNRQGTFYVDGVVYHFATAGNSTVVAAAHSAVNHKFLALKVRVYNPGTHSITVKPEDIGLEDGISGRVVDAVPGAELARRMRKPYNMARYAVSGIAGPEMDGPITRDMVSPEMLAMMRAMAARANGGPTPPASNVLYTDTPGALDDDDVAPAPPVCDQICRLRNRETKDNDVLGQLQRGASPDLVENASFRANTIPPGGNVAGVLYYPLGKLAESTAAAEHGKKSRLVRVTVQVLGEKFQFQLEVE